jgi:tagaturonate reductase
MGFAAYIFFMKPVHKEGAVYFGEINGRSYPINDDKAELFEQLWRERSPADVVNKVLNNASLWDTDLGAVPGFADNVTEKLLDIMQHGMLPVIQQEKIKA